MTDLCVCVCVFCFAAVAFVAVLISIDSIVSKMSCGIPEPEGIDKYDPFEDLANHCWLMSENMDLSETQRQAYQQAAGQVEAAHSLVQKAGRSA